MGPSLPEVKPPNAKKRRTTKMERKRREGWGKREERDRQRQRHREKSAHCRAEAGKALNSVQSEMSQLAKLYF